MGEDGEDFEKDFEILEIFCNPSKINFLILKDD